MSANVFGTPVYLYSAEDPANREGQDKTSNVSDRLQNALKAVKPLDSSRLSLQKALDSLDGTAYDQLKQSIQTCLEQISEAEKSVISQLGINDSQNPMNQTVNQPAQKVPTAGQISGSEPLDSPAS